MDKLCSLENRQTAQSTQHGKRTHVFDVGGPHVIFTAGKYEPQPAHVRGKN